MRANFAFFSSEVSPGEVVFGFLIEALQVALRLIGKWGIGEKLLQQFRRLGNRISTFASAPRAMIDDQLVDAPSLLVEKNLGAQAKRTIKILVYILRVRGHVNAQLLDHALGNGAIGSGALDREGASKTQAERAVHAEFVALGMSAEIIVIIENKDTGLVADRLAIEVGCCETADTAPDDDQIVSFASIFGLAR